MDINQVTYGTPTKEQYTQIGINSIVSDLFPSLSISQVPKNDSELVIEELNELSSLVKELEDPQNESYLKRYKSYDRNIKQSINSMLLQKGIDVQELTEQIHQDVLPLICRLKFKFQRPRPSQLAYYKKLKLFPYGSFTANSPSYPSAHTAYTAVVLNVIANHHPIVRDFCKDLIDDVAYSRLYLGLNYPTDNDFARLVANSILKHPEFMKKYKL